MGITPHVSNTMGIMRVYKTLRFTNVFNVMRSKAKVFLVHAAEVSARLEDFILNENC